MSYEIRLHPELGVLEVIYQGDFAPHEHRDARRHFATVARKNNITKILVRFDECDTLMQGKTVELYDFAASHMEDGIDYSFKIAAVRRKDDNHVPFLVTVSLNRGINMRDFDNRNDALVWLDGDRSAGPNTE